jgi:hypothetical protein
MYRNLVEIEVGQARAFTKQDHRKKDKIQSPSLTLGLGLKPDFFIYLVQPDLSRTHQNVHCLSNCNF